MLPRYRKNAARPLPKDPEKRKEVEKAAAAILKDVYSEMPSYANTCA